VKIAHINNIAGIAKKIANAQSSLKHESDVFVFSEATSTRFGGTLVQRSLPSILSFLKRLHGYDIIHYHYPHGKLNRILELGWLNLVKHYHGSELRGRREDDFCFVSTPDLLKFAPRSELLPPPIEVMKTQSRSVGQVPRVAFYPRFYGYIDYVSEPLRELQEEGKLTSVKIDGLSNQEALDLLSTCDIVVSRILRTDGWISTFDLEGMAMGRAVIAQIDDELYTRFKPPVHRTTKETFKRDMLALLEDSREIEKLGRMGQEYIERNHNPTQIAAKALRHYEELL
jgi:hypothetical protein